MELSDCRTEQQLAFELGRLAAVSDSALVHAVWQLVMINRINNEALDRLYAILKDVKTNDDAST